MCAARVRPLGRPPSPALARPLSSPLPTPGNGATLPSLGIPASLSRESNAINAQPQIRPATPQINASSASGVGGGLVGGHSLNEGPLGHHNHPSLINQTNGSAGASTSAGNSGAVTRDGIAAGMRVYETPTLQAAEAIAALKSDLLLLQHTLDTITGTVGVSPQRVELERYLLASERTAVAQLRLQQLVLQKVGEVAHALLAQHQHRTAFSARGGGLFNAEGPSGLADSPLIGVPPRPQSAWTSSSRSNSISSAGGSTVRPWTAAGAGIGAVVGRPVGTGPSMLSNVQAIIQLFYETKALIHAQVEAMNQDQQDTSNGSGNAAMTPTIEPPNQVAAELAKLVEQQQKLTEQVEKRLLTGLDLRPRSAERRNSTHEEMKLSADPKAAHNNSLNALQTPVKGGPPQDRRNSKTQNNGAQPPEAQSTPFGNPPQLYKFIERIKQLEADVTKLQTQLQETTTKATTLQNDYTTASKALEDREKDFVSERETLAALRKEIEASRTLGFGQGLFCIDVPLMDRIGIQTSHIPATMAAPWVPPPVEPTPEPTAKKAGAKGGAKNAPPPKKGNQQTQQSAKDKPQAGGGAGGDGEDGGLLGIGAHHMALVLAMQSQQTILKGVQDWLREHIAEWESKEAKYTQRIDTLETSLAAIEEKCNEIEREATHRISVAESERQEKVEEAHRMAQHAARLISEKTLAPPRVLCAQQSEEDFNVDYQMRSALKAKERAVTDLCHTQGLLEAQVAGLKQELANARAEQEADRRALQEAQNTIKNYEQDLNEAREAISSEQNQNANFSQQMDEVAADLERENAASRHLKLDLNLTQNKLRDASDTEHTLIMKAHQEHLKVIKLKEELQRSNERIEELEFYIRQQKAAADSMVEAYRDVAARERARVDQHERATEGLQNIEQKYDALCNDFQNFAKVKYDHFAKLEQEDKELTNIEIMLNNGDFLIPDDLSDVHEVELRIAQLAQEMDADERPSNLMSARKRLTCNLKVNMHQLQMSAFSATLECMKARKELVEERQRLERLRVQADLLHREKGAAAAQSDIISNTTARLEQERQEARQREKDLSRRVAHLEDVQHKSQLAIEERDIRISELGMQISKQAAELNWLKATSASTDAGLLNAGTGGAFT